MTGMEVSDGPIVQRVDDGLLTTVVDDELIGMSVENGTCYGLNEVATRIWDLLAGPRSMGAVCAQLTDEYAIDDATCRREVAALVAALSNAGLVTVREP